MDGKETNSKNLDLHKDQNGSWSIENNATDIDPALVDEFAKVMEKDLSENSNDASDFNKSPESSQSNPELNKAVEDVNEGDVSSVSSKKVVYGAARKGMIDRQKKEFNYSAEGIVKKPTEEEVLANAWEKAVGPESNITKELQEPTDFEKAKAEWSEMRSRSHALEARYNKGYHDYILNESKGFKGLMNLPRRMFGIQPKLTKELLSLQAESLSTRQQYKEAAKHLKNLKQAGHQDEVISRYQRMLAHHLTTGIHAKRLEAHKAAVFEAWKASSVRPALEALQKHKYARIGSMAVGYATLAGVTGGAGAALMGGGTYLARVAAAMGVGAGVGMGGQALYVEPLRKKLREATEQSGVDFFDKSLGLLDQEIGSMTFDVQAREARTRTASMAAGLGVGVATAGLTTAPDSSPVPSLETEATPETLSETTEIKETEAVIKGKAGEFPDLVYPKSAPDVDISEVTSPESPTPLREMGDLRVMEEMKDLSGQPEVEAETKIEEKIEPTPEVKSESQIEVVPDLVYDVQKGDNLWNIMEGKGPDANPVGGQSEVLKGMSLTERRSALDTLFDYMEHNSDFAKEAGIVKSGGKIDLIHPGEQINVSMLDNKLRELLGLDIELAEKVPGPSPEFISDNSTDTTETIKKLSSGLEVPLVDDFNQLRVGEVLGLQESVLKGDPEAIEIIESMGLDKDSLNDLAEKVAEQSDDMHDLDITIDELFNLQTESPKTIPELDVDPQGELDVLPDTSKLMREASLDSSGAENASQVALDNYVKSIEQPKTGFLGRLMLGNGPDISGTFDKITNLNFGQIKEIAQNQNLEEIVGQLGVTNEGYKAWMDELQELVGKIEPLSDSETIGQYVARINSPQVTA